MYLLDTNSKFRQNCKYMNNDKGLFLCGMVHIKYNRF